jgi:hypothetical protein
MKILDYDGVRFTMMGRFIMRFSLIIAFLSFAAGVSFSSPVKEISLNHIGYTPEASKMCVLSGQDEQTFEVIDVRTHRPRYQGRLIPHSGDFGDFVVGRFDAFREKGVFYIRSGDKESYPFRIAGDVYRDPMRTILRYFQIQRCGPSESGYASPCHKDDGYRIEDNKKTEHHQDVTGGWHDASDLRKWVTATIYGMIGLASVYESVNMEDCKEELLDELRWGNRYFLAMQEPDGYIMNHCAGDAFEHGDQNRWTDNIPGNQDDRLIRTEPCNLTAQYGFIYAEALLSRLVQSSDPEYARRCLEAAERCLEWCIRTDKTAQTLDWGAASAAALQLYKSTGDVKCKNLSVEYAGYVLSAQENDDTKGVKGYFFTQNGRDTPDKQIFHGCWYLLALCDLVESFPGHEHVDDWKRAIQGYCDGYLSVLTGKNVFGIVPYGLFRGEDPGGSRRIGPYFYRYFMKPVQGWWVGINANLASHGVGLVKAARVLDAPRYRHLAQRQLDWIVGCNPHNASMVTDLGYNQPRAFINWNEFRPHTPLIPGAVMNGMGGTMDDMPTLLEGGWETTEYWTPMIAYTLWLLGELSG